MFGGPFGHSIIGRAIEQSLLDVRFGVNPRDFATDRHRTVDDYAYGGGPGMVMKAAPIFDAVESVATAQSAVILMSPTGRVFSQQVAAEFSNTPHLVLVCGHYEGVDDRVREHLVTDEVSIGDYVLTGGGARRDGDRGRPWRGYCRECSGTPNRPATSRTVRACWSTRSTLVRLSSGAGQCLTFCSRVTTARWKSGGADNRWNGRRRSALT